MVEALTDVTITVEVLADLVAAEEALVADSEAKEVQRQEAVVSDQKLKEVLLQEVADFLKEHQEKVVLEVEEATLEVLLQELAEQVDFHQKDQHVVQKELQTEPQDVQKVRLTNQEKEDQEEVNDYCLLIFL